MVFPVISSKRWACPFPYPLLPPASVVEVIKMEPSVCLSVCQCSDGWTVWRMVTTFGIGIDLDDLLDKFDGQGQRSKSSSWNMYCTCFGLGFLCYNLIWVNRYQILAYSLMPWRNVMSWHGVRMSHDVTQPAGHGRCSNTLLPPASAVEVIKSVPCFRLSVCPSVC